MFHDRPNILHYGEAGEGVTLEPGMLFTIEPMINLGRPHVKVLPDGWTAVTRDRELSAQFEHSVGVTETGCEVFTHSPAGLEYPRFDRYTRASRTCAMPDRDKSGDGIGPVSEQGSFLRSAGSSTTRAIASGCASASARAAPTPCPTTSCWSWCCSAPFRGATPRASPSGCWRASAPSPKSINAPEPRLKELQDVGDSGRHRAEARCAPPRCA